MRKVIGILGICLALNLLGNALASAQVYKYKDKKGNWVFTDKKPRQQAEQVELKQTKPTQFSPRVWVERDGQSYQLMVDNPVHAPVQLILKARRGSKLPQRFLVEGPGRHKIYQSSERPQQFDYRWVLGQPLPQPKQPGLGLPFESKRKLLISQGFFGQFSHLDPGNRHAVDIAMPMGTNIVAARPGTVAIAKDDYPMSGVRRFFLDKANHITVLHQDGSYAVYAHILQGSAKVKPGDKVVSGQALARSGSSGYSTGPHLHFVVQHNAGGGTASVPFQFKSPKGGHFTPRQGQKLQSF